MSPARHTPSVSIVMCTYNAEAYLQPQLDSFLEQTVLPGELIVQDDASVDSTLAILDRFARKAPFPVSVESNRTRLGPTGNFEIAMGRAQQDVVFLSDADDIWLPGRVEAMLTAFRQRPSVTCVFADASLVTERLDPMGKTLWETIGFDADAQSRVEQGDVVDALFRRTIGFGGTMALRRAILQSVLPIPRPWGHDNYTAILAAATGELALIRTPNLKYRQHRSQYSGANAGFWRRLRMARGPRPVKDWVPRGGSYKLLAERLEMIREGGGGSRNLLPLLRHAHEKSRHLQMREGLSEDVAKRANTVLRGLATGQYHRYSNGYQSAIRDLIFGTY